MSDYLLVDTGFWIALYDSRANYHQAALELRDLVDAFPLIVPWPVLYEVLRTRFVRRPNWVADLDTRLKRGDVTFVDDREYRDDAYHLTVEASARRQDISMVDVVCRLILDDRSVKVDHLFTTNHKDFYDVCARRSVDILPDPK